MGLSGLEPPTSRLSGVRSNLLSYEPIHVTEVLPFPSFHPFGGDERVRTDDPLLAKQVLSQLSYTPILQGPRFSLYLFKLLIKKSVPSKLNNKLHLTLVLTRLLKQTRKYYFEVNDLDFASQNHNISG